MVTATVVNCGTDRSASEPTVSGSDTTSPRLLGQILPALDREQAISIAVAALSESDQNTTAVEGLRSPVARLMQLDELADAESLPIYGTYGGKLVWVVQTEGESRPKESTRQPDEEPVIFRFNGVILDALSGQILTRVQSENEPFILPLEFLPEDVVDIETIEHSVARSSLGISREEAISIIDREHKIQRRHDLSKIETVLVRYSNPSTGAEGSFGPHPTPTAVGHPGPTPTAGPTREATATSAPRPTRTPVVDRPSWLVIVPGELSFGGCFVSGPAGSTHSTCWMSVSYFIVDAETGALYPGVGGRGGGGQIGPRLTNEESLAFQHYAWAEGWWSLWHELRQFNGKRVPAGLASELNRPDAPTPTPRPPTPTPDPGLPPTPTPTPPPTPTPS